MQIKEEEHMKGHLCCIEVRLNRGPEMSGQNLLKSSLHFISFVVFYVVQDKIKEKNHTSKSTKKQ